MLGIFFHIDEVVTVQGQLKSIGGTVEVKTLAGGRVAEVLFSDGEAVTKGQLLLRFDTRQAADEKETLTRLIALEESQLKTQLETLQSQQTTLAGRKDVLQQRLTTQSTILEEMEGLVAVGGFQRLQFLQQQDQLFELQNQLSDLKEQENRLKLQSDAVQLESRKSIDQMRNRLSEAELQLQYQNVMAPVSGVVFDPQAGRASWQRASAFSRSFPSRGCTPKCLCPTRTSASSNRGRRPRCGSMHSPSPVTANCRDR